MAQRGTKTGKNGVVKVKLVTSTGYGWSGSSVIYNYLQEFDNVCVMPEYFEFRMVQEPDGISDLEYNLVENNHRDNTNHAIKQFIKRFMVAQRVQKIFWGCIQKVYRGIHS